MMIRPLLAIAAIATAVVAPALMPVVQFQGTPGAIAQARPNVGPGVPGSRPGGRRGGCPANLQAVQTLLFQNQTGKTTAASPIFLWHLSNAAPVNARFQLFDAAGNPVHVAVFNKPAPGFHPVKLPVGTTLQPDQEYTWSIAIICDPDSASKNPTAFGRITRVAVPPDLVRQLAAAKTPQARAEAYVSQNFWYDALTILWEAYAVAPNDPVARQQLRSLLEQMGHGDVIAQEMGSI